MRPTKVNLYKAIKTIQRAKIISDKNVMELNSLVESNCVIATDTESTKGETDDGLMGRTWEDFSDEKKAKYHSLSEKEIKELKFALATEEVKK